MTLTSTPVSAQTAYLWGLVNLVVDDDSKTLQTAIVTAHRISDNVTDVVCGYKDNIRYGMDMTLADAMQFEKSKAYKYYKSMPADLFEKMKSFNKNKKTSSSRNPTPKL